MKAIIAALLLAVACTTHARITALDVNTSTEYWQKGASLLHTDPAGTRDVALPPGARAYMVAGTQHGGRAGLRSEFGPCVNERNPHDPSPALRALLVALDEWASRGVAPPASRVPTIEGGTLVRAAAAALVQARLLLPEEDADAYAKWAQGDAVAKRFK